MKSRIPWSNKVCQSEDSGYKEQEEHSTDYEFWWEPLIFWVVQTGAVSWDQCKTGAKPAKLVLNSPEVWRHSQSVLCLRPVLKISTGFNVEMVWAQQLHLVHSLTTSKVFTSLPWSVHLFEIICLDPLLLHILDKDVISNVIKWSW